MKKSNSYKVYKRVEKTYSRRKKMVIKIVNNIILFIKMVIMKGEKSFMAFNFVGQDVFEWKLIKIC